MIVSNRRNAARSDRPSRLAIRLVLAGLLGLCGIAAVAAPSDLQILGVRPGMTRADAMAAMSRNATPVAIVEGYTAYGNGMLYIAPKSNFRPENVAFFSTLIGVDRRVAGKAGLLTDGDLRRIGPSLLNAPPCPVGQAVIATVHVQFSADVADPRVVLVDEMRRFCGKTPTVASEVAALRKRFGDRPTSTLRIRDDGLRVTPDTYGSVGGAGAFLEWRYDRPMGALGLANQVQMPMQQLDGSYWGFGNPGGGIAVHAEVRPTNDPTFIETIQTVLWDDDGMVDYGPRRYRLYEELDRRGIDLAHLADPRQATAVMQSLPPVRPTPKAPVAADPPARSGERLLAEPFRPDAVLTDDVWILKAGERLQYVRPFADPTRIGKPPVASVFRRDLAAHPGETSNPLVIVPDDKWRKSTSPDAALPKAADVARSSPSSGSTPASTPASSALTQEIDDGIEAAKQGDCRRSAALTKATREHWQALVASDGGEVSFELHELRGRVFELDVWNGRCVPKDS